jgi:hypothetical protein
MILVARVLLIPAVFGALALAMEAPELVRQLPIQAGIDARTARVEGTVVSADPDYSIAERHEYELTYTFHGRPWTGALRMVPARTKVGDRLCLELDTANPARVRPCGTRGDLAVPYRDTVVGLVLVGVGGLSFGYLWWRRGSTPTRREPGWVRYHVARRR